VLYEALTGARPYARDTDLATVYAHLSEPPPRVSSTRPELPSALDDVFATALAKNPDDRYATAGELVRAARQAFRAPAPKERPRRVLAVAAILATVVTAAVLATFFATRSHSTALKTKLFITPRGFVDAPLGLHEDEYKSIFVVGWRDDTFVPPHWRVLYYFDRGLGIYFERPGTGSLLMTTWNRHYRTPAGVGPCTTIAHLKDVYGNALRPSPFNQNHGKVYAYVIGNMIFGANGPPGHPSPTVTAVGVYRDTRLALAAFVTLSEPTCGADQF
jgi:hypothetical protein